jgi:hypothetical protein
MSWNIFLSECSGTAISASFNEHSRVTHINLLPMLCCVINSETRYITQEDLVMAQRFSRRPLTRSNPTSLNKVFVLEKSGTGTSFHRLLRFVLVSIVPPMLHKLSFNYRRRYTASENNSIVKQRTENTKKENFTIKLNILHSKYTGQLNVL